MFARTFSNHNSKDFLLTLEIWHFDLLYIKIHKRSKEIFATSEKHKSHKENEKKTLHIKAQFPFVKLVPFHFKLFYWKWDGDGDEKNPPVSRTQNKSEKLLHFQSDTQRGREGSPERKKMTREGEREKREGEGGKNGRSVMGARRKKREIEEVLRKGTSLSFSDTHTDTHTHHLPISACQLVWHRR